MDAIDRLKTALEGLYGIERKLGEGGMATVYLATDLKHKRHVALKVLKPEIAAVVGGERFLAEIETTAHLQHPHILPLFDSGEVDGILYYVMPWVEGESLRARLDREHQLPVDEAVRIAADVAEALHAAHEGGVIHRDVKPANILLSRGRPLVADFGIALAVSAAGDGRMTETGLSIGTPFYMSPEQASADANPGIASDIYSLACVLYEMLIGEPPYRGGSAQAVLARILLEAPPSATAQRRSVPPNVDAAVRKGLEKLPADRFGSAHEFAKALAAPEFRHGTPSGPAVSQGSRWRGPSVATTMLAAVLGLAAGLVLSPESETTTEVVERFVDPFDERQLPLSSDPGFSLSSDGTMLVYRGPGPDGPALLLRRWSDPQATVLEGTERGWNPSFEPGGERVVFWDPATAALQVVSSRGGPSRRLAVTKSPWSHWGRDGYVYFRSDSGAVRIAAEGGALETVTRSSSEDHFVSDVLPGGRIALYWADLVGGSSELRTVDLETGDSRALGLEPGRLPKYADSGRLLFVRTDSTLVTTGFDVESLEPTSEDVHTVPRVLDYTLSDSGKLFYLAPGQAGPALRQFVRVSRSGDVTPIDSTWVFEQGNPNFGFSLSPDGRRLAYRDYRDDNYDIWVKELDGGPLSRITFDAGRDYMPRWTADGEHVTFVSRRTDKFEVYSKRADGAGEAELVFSHDVGVMQGFFSPDGTWLLLRTNLPGFLRGDIYAVRPDQGTEATPLLSGDYGERTPALSPDGDWLAYISNETGAYEVYVRPFPDVDSRRWQVSTDGGLQPVWSRDGRELFYVTPLGEMMAARVGATGEFEIEERTALFSVPERATGMELPQAGKYDVTPDGRSFIMAAAVAEPRSNEAADEWILVNGFHELLREGRDR
jgi:serine/threonine-protein kinase